MVGDRALERCAHYSRTAAGAPGASCLSTTRSISRSIAALGSIRPAVSSAAMSAVSSAFSVFLGPVAAAGWSARLVASAPASL